MKFALQALFQTFFLRYRAWGFLCERAARFAVDYTQRTACHQKMVLVCCAGATVVRCWRSAVLRRSSDWKSARHRNGVISRGERSNARRCNPQCSASSPQMKGGLCMIDTTQTSFDKDKLEFAIFCIENVAKKLNQNPQDTFDALTKSSDILMSYIVASYDVLHTQGKDYIVNDIISCMKEKGVKV